MRECCGVDDDACRAVCAGFVEAVDDETLVIRLEVGEINVEGAAAGGEGGDDGGEGGRAVFVGFARSEEVEVGAVYEEDLISRC